MAPTNPSSVISYFHDICSFIGAPKTRSCGSAINLFSIKDLKLSCFLTLPIHSITNLFMTENMMIATGTNLYKMGKKDAM